uniref:Uncharacterized protein n=1 Tax=Latimeria chalumnae TaxID=7897 RepID=H3AJV9_LATCH
GCLIIGRSDKPHSGKVDILVKGNDLSKNKEAVAIDAISTNLTSHLGGLHLHGKKQMLYSTKLRKTAQAGDLELETQNSVDWNVGDEIAIATSNYDVNQTEIRKITAASGKTIHLNSALEYNHIVEANTLEDGRVYSLAADVAVLTRSIRMIFDIPSVNQGMLTSASVHIGTNSYNQTLHTGLVQITNVEFICSGSPVAVTPPKVPHFALKFNTVIQVSAEFTPFVKYCSFRYGAVGLFEVNGMDLEENTIYYVMGQGIHVTGSNVRVVKNLVISSLWSNSINDSEWPAAIEVSEGSHIVLQDNVVAGFQRAGFRIKGEKCTENSSPSTLWSGNEAYGGLYGVYMNKDGFQDCALVQGFLVWKCWDFGIYSQTPGSLIISNVTLVNNGMGIFTIVYSPPATSHQISDKSVLVKNSLLVGSSPGFSCNAVRLNTKKMILCICLLYTTFVNFKDVCNGEQNIIFMTNPLNEDLHHPIYLRGITLFNVKDEFKVFIHHPETR